MKFFYVPTENGNAIRIEQSVNNPQVDVVPMPAGKMVDTIVPVIDNSVANQLRDAGIATNHGHVRVFMEDE